MKFKRGLGFLTVSIIAVAPMAAVISCGAEANPLDLSLAIVEAKTDTNPFALNELPFKDGDHLFTKAQLKDFQDNLMDNLYYGPEAWDLKSITLDTGKITSGPQLGVYYPASKEMFINISDLEGTLANHPIDEVYKVIEKVIAHEYGHHFFATYANGYLEKDPAVKDHDGYVYDNTGTERYISRWNEKYFEEFKKEYHMDDTTIQPARDYKYNSNNIDQIFSLAQLFDSSNRRGKNGNQDYKLDWKKHTSVTFMSSSIAIKNNWYKSGYQNTVDKDNEGSLKYIYSMDEQVTRKMQMMFYPSKIPGGVLSFSKSLLKLTSAEKKSFFDPYSVDWMRTSELYRSGGDVIKASIYPDDIFASTDTDALNKAYSELLDLMGYGKEISHMYSANDARVSAPNRVVGLTKSNDNHVKLTGFVHKDSKGDPEFNKIVDQNGETIVEFDTIIPKFHFNHKAEWNDDKANVGPSNLGEFIPYITKQFYVKDFNGKQLFFQSPDGRTVPIKDINQDGDKTNVNSYDSQRSDSDTYYKIVTKNGITKVEVY